MDWRSTGSAFAAVMFLRSLPSLLPPEVYESLWRLLQLISHYLGLPSLLGSLDPTVTILIDEYDANGYFSDLYDSVQAYLSAKSLATARRLSVSRLKHSKLISYSLVPDETVHDVFHGASFTWKSLSFSGPAARGAGGVYETHSLRLTFHRRYRDIVHSTYLPHVLDEAAAIRFKNRERKLYTNRDGDNGGCAMWTCVPFSHPSTFDTLALDPGVKDEIKTDLRKFVGRKDYYPRVGRTWKRGYLIYGPPGTGKTSLIAAIANFLNFDVYDLELTAVRSNSHLRKLLVSTSTKSVIVVEDIDCTINLSTRINSSRRADDRAEKKSVNLSGVLNFIDGLWSSCGGERLMIFTTNFKENLDPALLRPGRMDKHINMGYCGFPAFKTLSKNYLNVAEHELMKDVEELLPFARMTPADVAEVFMGCDDDADEGMRSAAEAIRMRVQTEANPNEEVEKEVTEDVDKLESCKDDDDEQNEEEIQEEEEWSEEEEDDDDDFYDESSDFIERNELSFVVYFDEQDVLI